MNKQVDYELDAKEQEEADIDHVLATRDAEGAIRLSNIFAERDDMEKAEEFRNLARQWNREDWAYDESVGN
jgi:hypothetical protein